MSSTYHIDIIEHLRQIDAEQWNTMNEYNEPFLAHEFLSGLEETACVCEKTGWIPQHIVIFNNDTKQQVIAALPCYLKLHSYGEYIFDWSWADAYQRAGLNYYPKLSCAIPFTPATTAKWLIHPDYQDQELEAQLINYLKQHAKDCKVSSIHALFTNQTANNQFKQHGFIQRASNQFHWYNQDINTPKQAFVDFNDYLQTMNSRKRKNIKRERKNVVDQGVYFRWYHGDELNADIAQQIFSFYLSTTYRYGAQQYLTEAFFQHFVKTLPHMTHVLIAYIGESAVAGSLFFGNASILYGRYWGANADIKDLHFETCYYQPIEYAINKNMQRFEAGAQGEHKLSRGLMPVITTSQHWLADQRFHVAVEEFTRAEAENISLYQQSIEKHGPFKASNKTIKPEI